MCVKIKDGIPEKETIKMVQHLQKFQGRQFPPKHQKARGPGVGGGGGGKSPLWPPLWAPMLRTKN